MLKKKLCFIQYLTFTSLVHSCEEFSVHILWGMLYLFVLILLSFGCLQVGESPDCFDFSSLEVDPIMSGIHTPLVQPYQIHLLPGIFALILFFEYLRSHFGEKEPPDRKSDLYIATFMKNVRTALLYSAVFLFAFRTGTLVNS